MLWQLADSAFPTGGFAHSGGLEAAWRAGHVVEDQTLEGYCRSQLLQCASGVLPLALMAHRDSDLFTEADERCDLLLNHPISNRASRVQGRGLLAAARQIYPACRDEIKDRPRAAQLPGHFGPTLGAVCRVLKIDEIHVGRLLLFMGLRGTMSAAVKLGIVGSMAAQAMQHRLGAFCDELVDRSRRLPVDAVAQTAPISELFAACQDRLYSRLFQT
ncbi:MAG: urease accessory protein UreF [Planctomycetota bacterium]|nr:urease accessory protein UreF [Planctomycetota bacterium]